LSNIISYKEFESVDIRVGTIISAEENLKLNNPSIMLKIDFGEKIGVKKSSAQLIKNYQPKDLINKQIAAVVNFESKQIGNLISEVLVLGFPDTSNEPILIEPNKMIPNGGKLF
jgi:tRNA-binding protein